MNNYNQIEKISQLPYEGTPEKRGDGWHEARVTAYDKWMQNIKEQERKEAQEAKRLENLADESDDKPRRTSLNIVMADELPDDYEAPDELVEGLLTVGAGSILYGDSNAGKTFFAIDIACAVARGEPWMDRRVQQGLVIYLASESPQSVRSRLQAYKQYHECTVPNFAVVQEPVNLWVSDEDTDLLISQIQEVAEATGKQPALIVGDTLARISAGGNENSGEDMGTVIERFDRIRRETGAHFMMIHHSGKDQAKGARGHSSLRAAVDTEIEVQDTQAGRFARVTKQRDLAGKGAQIGFKLHAIELGRNKWGSPASMCVVLPADAPVKGPKLGPAETKILELLAVDGPLTRVQIAAKVAPGKAPQSTYNAVGRLEDKKLVVADGDKYKLPSLGGL
ncbi:helicase RepA family protein [Burkholderia multivorans]|uniref:helicase RepA family protein n=1 Tax=Burkholderia multivorans TaxID=87883 RepID=UPI001C23FA19|nr:helicase RepA family protein [Burkholderia multivorans]MBU9690570.1 helicase RepA family protein [Burkholderia multivorans]